jgi:hypothetical protein
MQPNYCHESHRACASSSDDQRSTMPSNARVGPKVTEAVHPPFLWVPACLSPELGQSTQEEHRAGKGRAGRVLRELRRGGTTAEWKSLSAIRPADQH